jgi:internalin A
MNATPLIILNNSNGAPPGVGKSFGPCFGIDGFDLCQVRLSISLLPGKQAKLTPSLWAMLKFRSKDMPCWCIVRSHWQLNQAGGTISMTQEELLQLIQQAKENQSTILDLSRKDLTELPPDIAQLSDLKQLDLGINQLRLLPPEIGQLSNLQVLHLSFNQLIQLPREIGQLGNLRMLHLSDNQLSHLPTEIGQLSNLLDLDLDINHLSQLPAEIGQLSNLILLHLNNNRLNQLPIEIGQLSDLRALHLINNRLSQLPIEIGQLSNLEELTLSHNVLGQLPLEIAQLNNLRLLDIRDNSLLQLPNDLPQQLVVLDLRDSIHSLPTRLGHLTQQGEGVYLPKNAPPLPLELLEKHSWEIFSYINEADFQPLNEAKLILVGDGAVGKTCLVNQLLHDKFTAQTKTEGIDIHRWQNVPVNNQSVRVNVWDFGGQEVLHATHQFFLTKRSLYLLVLDARRGEQESRLEYWLKLISSFAGESPILVVINKTDEEHRLTLNERFLQGKYPSIRGFYPCACSTGKGIAELKTAIEQKLAKLHHIHDLIPASWFALKTSLEQRADNYISYHNYQELCQQQSIIEENAQRTLCGFLHDLGIALNFQNDNRLRDTNVLNPEWVTNGVYKLLNNLELFQQQGVVDLAAVGRILPKADYPSDKEHRFIIDMMQKFELCFPIDGTETYLIPELLPNQEPDLNWPKEDSLAFQYHYDILPHSVISRFIVRLHNHISQHTYWRTGVVLAYEHNKALVKADMEDKKIFVWVTGNSATRRSLLAIIRREFKHILDTIAKIEAKEKVPYKNGVVDYQHLLTLEKKGVKEFIPEGLDEPADVKELLEGYREKAETTEVKTMPENKEKYLMFGFSIAFIIVIITIALFVPNPTAFQYTIFRVVLALFAAGTAIMIPGALEITIKNWLKATGAIAVFVIVYFYSPASLVHNPETAQKTTSISQINHP